MRLLQNLSHRVFPLFALLFLAASGALAQQVFLNEVDADSYTVPDSLEFVELFGAPDQRCCRSTMKWYLKALWAPTCKPNNFA